MKRIIEEIDKLERRCKWYAETFKMIGELNERLDEHKFQRDNDTMSIAHASYELEKVANNQRHVYANLKKRIADLKDTLIADLKKQLNDGEDLEYMR
jgi:hypothetical protein